jgi:CheY-like chemotaxis protein
MQVLIAHRDAAVRASLTKAITGGLDSDLDVVERDRGTAALELLLQEKAPRLAVVDWDMPGLDGPELCRIVRDFHLGGPPYVVLLASADHPNVEEGLLAGANDCIRTPARASEIKERVEAGRSFIEVPWECASRNLGLEAVIAHDDEDEAWGGPAGGSAGAGSGASSPVRAELQAVLHQL